MEVQGQYVMNTGRSLAELPADMMFAAVYYAMISTVSHLDENVIKARESFKKVFRSAQFEHETGMPAIAMSLGIMPADARDHPGDPLPPPPDD